MRGNAIRRCGLAAAAALLVAGCTLPPAGPRPSFAEQMASFQAPKPHPPARASVFGSRAYPDEVESAGNLVPLLRASIACAERAGCMSEPWPRYVAEIAALPPRERLDAVNRIGNEEFRYVARSAAADRPEHVHDWLPVQDFLAAGAGQCTDIALFKYVLLRAAGVPEASLRLAAVVDRMQGFGHAILIVRLDGVDYVLDNLLREVATTADLALQYRVTYSASGGEIFEHVSRSCP